MPKNNFYEIGDLTKKWEQYKSAPVGTQPHPSGHLLEFQVGAQFAIAQQLSVISGHMGRLVALLENKTGGIHGE